MKKKKLLLVGGGSIHLKNYYDLISDFFESSLIITNTKRYDFGNSDVNIENFGLRNPFSLIKSVRKIRKATKAFSPDIIHIHQANSFSFITILAVRHLKIPIIITAWGDDILILPKKNFILRKMVLYSLKHAQAFTSDSANMSAEIKRLTNTDNKQVITVNFGVDVDKTIKIKSNTIYSNRLHFDFYRIDKIIYAFDRFATINPNWKLIIAGEGEATEKLKEIAKSVSNSNLIEFVGWVDKPTNQNYYNISKMFISIPTTDATSASLLEAIASDCIPIVSDLPANMEWVIDGINGIIVDNINEDFISRALSINSQQCISINQQIIKDKATKEVSRNKFTLLYTHFLD
jgi:glycosyltransferase involved in cell wall biosynthesis